MSNLYKFVVNRGQVLEDEAKLKGNDFWAFIDDVANSNAKPAPSCIVKDAIQLANFWSRTL